jgi:hypothetical protein
VFRTRRRPKVNDHIRRQTEINLAYFAQRPEQIAQRLRELDEEWDVERVLETGSSTLTLTGLLLGVASSRKWLLLSFGGPGVLYAARAPGLVSAIATPPSAGRSNTV